MKTIAADHSYVDYKADAVGVRVRRERCRPLALQRGRWVESGVPYAIPVSPGQLQVNRTGISALAAHVVRVEESADPHGLRTELRQVITGEVPFEAVAAR